MATRRPREPSLRDDIFKTKAELKLSKEERQSRNITFTRQLTKFDLDKLDLIKNPREKLHAQAEMLTPVHGGDVEEIVNRIRKTVGSRRLSEDELGHMRTRLRAILTHQPMNWDLVNAYSVRELLVKLRDEAKSGKRVNWKEVFDRHIGG